MKEIVKRLNVCQEYNIIFNTIIKSLNNSIQICEKNDRECTQKTYKKLT